MQNSSRLFFRLENDLREIETSSNYFASFYLKMCIEETSNYEPDLNFRNGHKEQPTTDKKRSVKFCLEMKNSSKEV